MVQLADFDPVLRIVMCGKDGVDLVLQTNDLVHAHDGRTHMYGPCGERVAQGGALGEPGMVLAPVAHQNGARGNVDEGDGSYSVKKRRWCVLSGKKCSNTHTR